MNKKNTKQQSKKMRKKFWLFLGLSVFGVNSLIYSLLFTAFPVYLATQYVNFTQNTNIEYTKPSGYLMHQNGINIKSASITKDNIKANLENINLKLLSLSKVINYNFGFNIQKINLYPALDLKLKNTFTKPIFSIDNIHGDFGNKSYHIYYNNKPFIWQDNNSSKNNFSFTLTKSVKTLDFLPSFNAFYINADFQRNRINWSVLASMDKTCSLSTNKKSISKSCYNNALKLTGFTNLKNYIPGKSQFKLTTPNPETIVTQTSEAQIYGAPDLDISFDNNQLDISGSIIITRGLIKPTLESSIQTTDDIKFIDELVTNNNKSTNASNNQSNNKLDNIFDNITTHTNINLVASNNNLLFKTKDLSANLGGNLKLMHTSRNKNSSGQDSDVIAQGEIKIINGVYKLFGHPLKITQGKLLYSNNPIDNPSIKLIGKRKVKLQHQDRFGSDDIANNSTNENKVETKMVLATEGEIAINISGTLNKPDIKLSSSTTMPEADKISYLLFGVPSHKMSQAHGQILMETAKQLFADDDDEYSKIAQGVKDIVNIDELSLENKANKEPRLIIGKTFFSKLLVRYGLSVTQPFSSVTAEYKIKDNLKLTAQYQHDNSASIDIIYSKESDRLL